MRINKAPQDKESERPLNIVMFYLGFPGDSDGKESAYNAGDLGSIPGPGRSLEKGTATHSRILAWRIPWTEEPGGLQLKGVAESDTTEQVRMQCSTKI